MGEVFHESMPLNDNYIKKDFLGAILSISLKHYQKSNEIQFFRIENIGVLRKKEIFGRKIIIQFRRTFEANCVMYGE